MDEAALVRAELELRYGAEIPTRAHALLAALLERVAARQDDYARARVHLLLAQTTPAISVSEALAQAETAADLSRIRGYAHLDVQASAVARLFGSARPPSGDVEQHEVIELGDAVVRAENLAFAATSLGALSTAMERVPHRNQPHLRRMILSALEGASLRRITQGAAPHVIIDPEVGEIWCGSERVARLKPTSNGYKLFAEIARRGSELTREALFEHVWEVTYRPPSSDNSLYVALHRLRKTLKSDSLHIDATEEGGYRLRGRLGVYHWSPGSTVEIEALPPVSPPVETPAETKKLSVAMPAIVGRQAELTGVGSAFDGGARLVTLTGPGGCGKTTLARSFASQQETLAGNSGGIWFVDLTGTDDAGDFLRRFAGALGISVRGDDPTAIADEMALILSSRGETLVVFDGFDRLVRDAAALIERWLWSAPHLRMLMTSRERLDLVGEHVLELSPMTAEESLELFEQCARRKGRFAAIAGREEAIRAVVDKLDGLPLAIELAAGRLDVLSPVQLVEQLDDRFRVLATLVDTISWSWDLLDRWERRVILCCAVFSRTFTLEDIEALAPRTGDEPWPGDVLQALVRKSLVRQRPSDDGRVRLELLDSIRDFVRDRLVENPTSETLLDQHAARVLAEGERLAAHLRGPRSVSVLDEWHAMLDDLIAVFERSLGRSLELAVRVVNVVEQMPRRPRPFGLITRLLEVDGALEGVGLVHRLDFRLHEIRMHGHTRNPIAREVAQSAVQMARELGDPRRIGDAIFATAWAEMVVYHQYEAALAGYRDAADAYAEARYDWGEAEALHRVGVTLKWLGRTEEAAEVLYDSAARFETLGAEMWLAPVLGNLGSALRVLGDADAENCIVRSLDIWKRANMIHLAGTNLINLGNLYIYSWRLDEARAQYEAGIRHLEHSGRWHPAAVGYLNLGELHYHLFDAGRARMLFNRSRHRFQRQGSPQNLAMVDSWLAVVHLDRGKHEEARSTLLTALKVVEDLGSRHVVAEIHHRLGLVARDEGDLDAARTHFEAAESVAGDTGERRMRAHAEAGLATLDHLAGDLAAAARKYASAGQLFAEIDEKRSRGCISCWQSLLATSADVAERHLAAAEDCFGPSEHTLGLSIVELYRRGLGDADAKGGAGLRAWGLGRFALQLLTAHRGRSSS